MKTDPKILWIYGRMERNEVEDSDKVTIIVDGGTFTFHGRELADKSDYFDAMFFKSCMKESITKQVELKYVMASDMEVIRDFVLGNDPPLNEQNILSVTSLSTMLQMTKLCEKCCDFLSDITTPLNSLSIMNFSEHQSLHGVLSKAKRTAMWNFLEVLEGEEYLALTLTELTAYLGNTSLNLHHRADAVYAILKWSRAVVAQNSRCSDEETFTLLAIFGITDEATCNVISQNGADLSKLSLAEIREEFKNLQDTSFHNRGPSFPRVLLIVGGDFLYHDSKLPNTKMSYFDSGTKSVKTLTNIPFQEGRPACSMGYKCCVVGKDLYITGGEKHRGRNQWCRDVWRYDPFEDVWDIPTELPGPRRHHCVCTDGVNLYLIGGFGSYRYVLDTIDVFNVDSGEWSNLPPMPRAEFSASCAYDSEHIYVIKSIVQIYSKATCSWTLINPTLPYNSRIHSLHLFSTRLLMVAEFLGKLIEFETDSGQNAETIADFKEACGAGCLIDGVFYMVGGSDMDESASVEAFDTKTNVREIVAKLESALACHCCVALPFWPTTS